MSKNNIFKFIFSIIIAEGAGIIGSIFTAPSISTWYINLIKPVPLVPNWVFAPVWTTLFLLMGIALFFVWKKGIKNKESRFAIIIFFIQLILNVIWSILFFGLHNPGLAFIEIIILWIFILLNIISFYRVSRISGLLLIPYILWVSFASYLNFMIWFLN